MIDPFRGPCLSFQLRRRRLESRREVCRGAGMHSPDMPSCIVESGEAISLAVTAPIDGTVVLKSSLMCVDVSL